MTRARLLLLATLALACAVMAAGCAERTPTMALPEPTPSDTVVYDVPTAPSSPGAERPATIGPTDAMTAPPPTPGAVTALPPGERGPIPEARLTILHTNDTRGYLDPCG